VGWCGLTSTSKRLFRVLQSSNGGASYGTTVYSSTTATSTTRSLSVGASYRFRVRTGDGAGRYSGYATSVTTKVLRFDDKSASIVYSSGWATASSSNYSSGTEHYATSSGASATFVLPASTRTFAIVGSRASTRGSYQVWVDDVLVGTVSQKASSSAYKVIQYVRSVTSTATHTIKLVPVGNGRIDLDAILAIQ
jgi:hypothetical protein